MHRDYNNLTYESCSFVNVQRVVQGKWTMPIIYFLNQGTLRFSELNRKLPQVTQANLTKELRLLEKYGMVHREVYREVPPKVEYSLTDLGRSFLPVMEAIETWMIEYEQHLEKNNFNS